MATIMSELRAATVLTPAAGRDRSMPGEYPRPGCTVKPILHNLVQTDLLRMLEEALPACTALWLLPRTVAVSTPVV